MSRLVRAKRLPKDILAGVGIAGVTGVNGAGKTSLAAQSVILRMAQGQRVYSTVQVNSEYGNTIPLVSIRQLLELRDCTVFLDDVAVIFSSRSTQSLPPDVVAFLDTCRHSKVSVIWTSPTWMRCDNLLRGVTQANLNVMPVPLFRQQDGSPWPRPRFILAGLMDCSAGKVDQAPTKIMRRRLYRQAGLLSFGAYDSHADTPLIGRHLQSGVCIDCGGSQPREKHSRERHDLLGLPWYDDAPRVAAEHGHPAVTFVETENAPA